MTFSRSRPVLLLTALTLFAALLFSYNIPAASATTVPVTKLTVTSKLGPKAKTAYQATLTCTAAKATGTGMLASPASAKAACAAVASRGSLLRQPSSTGRVCSFVYSGPQTSKVTGLYNSKTVNKTFSRTNSCDTADFKALQALLGNPGFDIVKLPQPCATAQPRPASESAIRLGC